jgi:C4-dicarboxylate-specific signal transduction histidine kinase
MRSIKIGDKSREILMILREISERKLLEEGLRRSEERYRRAHRVGITDKVRRNLFKPFYTTKPKGMGLGLASTRQMVEVQGGTGFVESKDDEGSTFSIALPLKDKST